MPKSPWVSILKTVYIMIRKIRDTPMTLETSRYDRYLINIYIYMYNHIYIIPLFYIYIMCIYIHNVTSSTSINIYRQHVFLLRILRRALRLVFYAATARMKSTAQSTYAGTHGTFTGTEPLKHGEFYRIYQQTWHFNGRSSSNMGISLGKMRET